MELEPIRLIMLDDDMCNDVGRSIRQFLMHLNSTQALYHIEFEPTDDYTEYRIVVYNDEDSVAGKLKFPMLKFEEITNAD